MEGSSAATHEERVTPLELFFDLVFVFAATQVTAMLSSHPTWSGLLQAILVLGAIWWAWAAYAWLTNTLNPEEGKVRIAMFAAMGAMLIVSLAVPEAFDQHALVFAVAYAFVRAMHLVLYAIAGRSDPDLLGAVLRFVPSVAAAALLLVAASFFDGWEQITCWVGALVIDYAGPLVGRGAGWHLHPRHFVERHALIIIIALGESIVALGVGAGSLELGFGVILAALLGMTVVCTLWWAYFDWAAIVIEQRLEAARGLAANVLARDAYSYLHFPMVAGIVLFAVGLKKTLGTFDEPLKAVPATALCLGLALYFLAHVLLRDRVSRTIGHGRPVAVVLLAATLPLAVVVPALAALVAVSAICVGLIAYEALRYRDVRRLIRSGVEATPELMSAARGRASAS